MLTIFLVKGVVLTPKMNILLIAKVVLNIFLLSYLFLQKTIFFDKTINNREWGGLEGGITTFNEEGTSDDGSQYNLFNEK